MKEEIKYEGMFEDGKKNGIGTVFYPNGDFYYGEWTND
jgi:radial spoke head protein 1